MANGELVKASESGVFDPNQDAKSVMFPSVEGIGGGGVGVIDSTGYLNVAMKAMDGGSVAKALGMAPQMMSFGAISYMPDGYDSNLLQWPGIAPESLGKVARENLAPQLIIGMRCDDVLRYSQLSTQIWRPGWQIEPVLHEAEISTSTKKRMREAEQFLLNCNIETSNASARKRDAKGISNFTGFLSAIVRDTLTFDEIAVWTDMDHQDQVKAFAAMPSSRFRLVAPGKTFQGDPKIYIVAVDEGGTPKHAFTRDQLTFYRRNVRESIEALGYGYSEIEIAIRLIQGFQNAMDFNISTFDRNAIPPGILVMSGETVTQKQLDLLNRMWSNLKKGVTKAWTLPVIGLAGKDSKLELMSLNDVKGMEVYYQDFMNMVIGAFCTIYRFPVRRLGYRISGKGKDTEPLPDSGSAQVGDDDPGLAPLLMHIENIVNEYLIWSRWPDLKFVFNAKSPIEDARAYEALRLSRTWGEARAEAGLPPLEDLAEDSKSKKMAKVLNLAPVDPGMDGVFQALISAVMAPKPAAGEGAGGKDGARMGSKKDPAKSENHGGTSGVRRNSRNEKKRAGSK